ncbi:UNVERIFIED_CONTAM: hypothetical protein K2H54_064196, partial [Gekko kuhli]
HGGHWKRPVDSQGQRRIWWLPGRSCCRWGSSSRGTQERHQWVMVHFRQYLVVKRKAFLRVQV